MLDWGGDRRAPAPACIYARNAAEEENNYLSGNGPLKYSTINIPSSLLTPLHSKNVDQNLGKEKYPFQNNIQYPTLENLTSNLNYNTQLNYSTSVKDTR